MNASVAPASRARTLTEDGVFVEVAEGFDRLSSLRDAWEDLFLSRPNEPSTSFEWTSAMVTHHVRAGDRCFMVQLHQGSRLVGLVPLVARQTTMMGRHVTLLAPLAEEYNTHSDLLLASVEDDVVGAFLSALFDLPVAWDCFRMARLLEENPLSVSLRRCLAADGLLHRVWDGMPAYVLPMPKSFDQYLADRSGKFRNHLKRVERKLDEAGAVEVREVSGEGELDEAYTALLEVERSSWKHDHGTSITAVGRQTGFYRDLARGALASGRLHLQWLTLDGRPIAYNLGYLTAGRYHYLKTSYDHSCRPLSPSTALRARLIASLIDRGVSQLDFPGEPYEWETQWTDAVRWRTVIALYPGTVRGRMLSLVDSLKHRTRGERRVEHADPRAARPPKSRA